MGLLCLDSLFAEIMVTFEHDAELITGKRAAEHQISIGVSGHEPL